MHRGTIGRLLSHGFALGFGGAALIYTGLTAEERAIQVVAGLGLVFLVVDLLMFGIEWRKGIKP